MRRLQGERLLQRAADGFGAKRVRDRVCVRDTRVWLHNETSDAQHSTFQPFIVTALKRAATQP